MSSSERIGGDALRFAALQQIRFAFIIWLLAAALMIGGCAAPGILRDAAPRMTAISPAASELQSSPQAVMAASVTPVSTQPAVLTFTVNPTATLQVGDAIAVQWQAIGDRAELCMISGPGPVDCHRAPLDGQQTVTVTEAMLGYSGIGLRVTIGETFTWALSNLRFACQAGTWFFAAPPQRCPEAAPAVSAAAYQPFEHGFMIWTQTPDRFYVFFEDEQQFLFADAPYDFAPDAATTAAAPAGLYAPVSGFGKLWRNELTWWGDTDVSARLGWATAPEAAYTATRQCELPSYPGMWSCYLRTPDGRVLATRPDSTAQVHFVWEWQ